MSIRATTIFVPQSERRGGQLNKIIHWQDHHKSFDTYDAAEAQLLAMREADQGSPATDRFRTGRYRVIKRTTTVKEREVALWGERA